MTGYEILPVPLDRQSAIPIIEEAVKHFSVAKRASIQVMADLRRLYNGQVHLLYGYTNFGKWAEDTFEGLSAGNVRQLCRVGAAVLELDRRELIDLENPTGVGTTGLRELSAILTRSGADVMAATFETAKEMVKDKEITDTTVKAAMRLLNPPEEEDGDNEEGREELEEVEDELEKYSPKARELIDQIRDLSWDLPETSDEIADAVKRLKEEIKGEVNTDDDEWKKGKR